MRIGEVAEITGLSISNIRFYDKKGLVGPARDAESKYRNYTEEDVAVIRKIVLFRKMDFSVELIGKLLKEEISMEEALAQQLSELQEKQKTLQGSIDLCQKLVEDKAYTDIDVDTYMNYVKEEEAKGKLFADINSLIDDISTATNYDRFLYDNLIGMWLLCHPRVNTVVKFLWGLMIGAMPIIGIVDLILDEDTDHIGGIIFLLMWFIIIMITIHMYRRDKKNVQNK